MFPTGNIPAGIGLLGAGMIVLAIAILGTVLGVWLFGKLLPAFIRAIAKACRSLFRRKEQRI